jgi:hypothetical protein
MDYHLIGRGTDTISSKKIWFLASKGNEFKLVLELEFVLPEWKLVPLGISHRTLSDLARAVDMICLPSWNNKVLSNAQYALGNHPGAFNFF